MTSKTDIKIYIDNTGQVADAELGDLLKERVLSLKLDAPYEVKTFKDLDEPKHDTDPDNEANTLKAINDANIVIPVISTFYVNYVTKNIESAINRVINSADKYLFPVLLDEADWSNHDWVVKSQVTPEDAKPLSSYSKSDKQKIINGLKRILLPIYTLHLIKVIVN